MPPIWRRFPTIARRVTGPADRLLGASVGMRQPPHDTEFDCPCGHSFEAHYNIVSVPRSSECMDCVCREYRGSYVREGDR